MPGRLLVYHLTQRLSLALPTPAAMRLAQAAADVQYRRSPADRAAVSANLRVLLGRAVAEDDPSVREVFHHFGWYLAEFLSIHRRGPTALTVDGVEPLVRTLQAHRGGVLVSAHLGNWEFGAIALRWAGLPITVVELPHADARVNRFFNSQRQRCGVDVIRLDVHAARHCLRNIRKGRWVGLVGDREFGQGGVPVSFFGRPVLMPSGPAAMSLRSGCPIVPVCLIRTGWWRFRFLTTPPLWPQADSENALIELTQRSVRTIEDAVRAAPTQWSVFRPMFQSPASMATALPAAVGAVGG